LGVSVSKHSDLRWVLGAVVTLAVSILVPLYALPDMFGPADAIAFVGILVTASVSLRGIVKTCGSAYYATC